MPELRERPFQLVEPIGDGTRTLACMLDDRVELLLGDVANTATTDLVRQPPAERLVAHDQDEQHDRPDRHGPLELPQQAAS